MLIALCLAPWAMGEFGYSAFLLVGTDAGLVDRYSAYHPTPPMSFTYVLPMFGEARICMVIQVLHRHGRTAHSAHALNHASRR